MPHILFYMLFVILQKLRRAVENAKDLLQARQIRVLRALLDSDQVKLCFGDTILLLSFHY